ncbi:hypothetical protein D9615_002719 [Tricholomella constricta]|uniref:Reverse transcriptase domain-containing protein n=1 Tax=Tricholomella constricta TaxID=117010 RepID=A0A8H5HFK0_9AGAR|nr:hypothetical protein D9615_002719 [Tricholomella constricta]
MREQCLDVITIQEAHLNDTRRDEIQQTFGENMHLLNSWDRENPNARGIAFVLNKRTTRWKEAKVDEPIPGRAILLHLPWHENNVTKILGVYAPNATADNTNFWEDLEQKWRDGSYTKPDVLLGDLNLIEDSMDRLPARAPPQAPTEALSSLKSKFGLVDGWRQTYPTTRKFTFRTENGDSQSRLDRIYIAENLTRFSHQWEITNTGISTDHKLVSVRLLNPAAPHLGKGRYAIPNTLLRHKDLVNQITELSMLYQTKLDELDNKPRDENNNPQREHKIFKDKLAATIRKYAKSVMPKIQKTINNLGKDRDELVNNAEINDEEKRTTTALLDERITQLEKIRHNRARDNLATKCRLENETNSKFWYQLNKPKKPRDTIAALKKPNVDPPTLSRKSSEMAQIARQYHESLQKEEIPEGLDIDTETEEVLRHLNKSLAEEKKAELAHGISKQEVRQAIRDLPKGKSPGIDGLTHELWIIMLEKFEQRNENDDKSFDIVTALTKVFNDIEQHGVEKHTDFSKGWMCPLYKKNDRTDISNYRPITVLNSDYKIFTRALTSKLSKAVPELIHRDQAGFMKGRRIEDQTELIKMIISRCEAQDENGAIVCLDQEKAYDRINHTFLWKSMLKFNFPEEFISTVKHLYSDAETVVILNGEISTPYKVTRGVRQGDPLSCLLFNLAIESLAQMLRNSNLEGFQIKDECERLIATLFADDTTVFLSQNDNFPDLQNILVKWCDVSGANFNVPKTTIIPVGNEDYRKSVIESRTFKHDSPIIPANIRIADDGEPTRVLGAFVGNHIDQLNIWTPVMDKITRDLEMWNKGRPTLKGRSLILKSIIGGYTQFLTRVQGMPKAIENRLDKACRDYMWNGTKIPPVNQTTLNQEKYKGGQKCLNIKARNEAIELTKLKSYLRLDNDRPRWAKVADELMNRNISTRRRVRDETSIVNPYLQNYKIKTRSTNTSLPESLIKMIRTADKYNASFAPIALSTDLKNSMPMWYHIGVSDDKTLTNNDEWARCQRSNHHITTVGEMEAYVDEHPAPGERVHKERINCACACCRKSRLNGCLNPDKCKKAGRKSLNTLSNKWNPKVNHALHIAQAEDPEAAEPRENDTDVPVAFNQNYTTGGGLTNGLRIFVNKETKTNVPATQTHDDTEGDQVIEVWTDGSCIANGDEDARAGSGLWYGENDERNLAIRLPPNMEQSNNAGEATAILIAAQRAPPNATLHILSDSKIVIDGLTKNLTAWEDKGWIGVLNKDILKATVAQLRMRKGKTLFTKVKGHSGNMGNDGADALANEGAMKDPTNADAVDLQIPPNFDLSGAKLTTVTQALLYQGIMELSTVKIRRKTLIHLDMVRHTIKDNVGNLPSDRRIWNSLQCKDISRNISAFLWRTMHNSYPIGDFWSRITNFEHRSQCQTCNTEESMDHILTECPDSCQDTIWRLAENLWSRKGLPWFQPTIGMQLGCALVSFKDEKGKPRVGASRLYKIIMTESTHLIWKLRCEWRIGRDSDPEKKHTKVEAENRWYEAINRRLKFDCLMTDNMRYGRKAIRSSLVRQTWKNTLQNEENLPENWYAKTGVLVGRGTERPRGRNR